MAGMSADEEHGRWAEESSVKSAQAGPHRDNSEGIRPNGHPPQVSTC